MIVALAHTRTGTATGDIMIISVVFVVFTVIFLDVKVRVLHNPPLEPRSMARLHPGGVRDRLPVGMVLSGFDKTLSSVLCLSEPLREVVQFGALEQLMHGRQHEPLFFVFPLNARLFPGGDCAEQLAHQRHGTLRRGQKPLALRPAHSPIGSLERGVVRPHDHEVARNAPSTSALANDVRLVLSQAPRLVILGADNNRACLEVQVTLSDQVLQDHL
mmetsp:Transcript_25083/g.44599  ORF Transcript_25083/g.44599 Transcript_25083/m.44599 type:complete len:216 (+) Transcript_25083:586-1233(+)